MSLKKLAIGITVVSAISLAASSLALASGQAWPIRQCTDNERYVTGPNTRQAFVFSNPNLGGTCWVLELSSNMIGETWGGYDVSEGLPNDNIESVWVGSYVRLKLFWAWFYTHDEGGALLLGPGGWNLGSWNNAASAARLEWGGQPSNCAVQNGMLSIWDTAGAPGSGDCNMLHNFYHYADAVKMAFRNDNMSAFASGGSARSFELYNASNYGSWVTSTYQMSCGNMASLPACGIYNYGTPNANNKVSSVY